jgi:hypothetical protein
MEVFIHFRNWPTKETVSGRGGGVTSFIVTSLRWASTLSGSDGTDDGSLCYKRRIGLSVGLLLRHDCSNSGN